MSANTVETQKNHNYELNVEIRRGQDLADKKMIGGHSIYIAIDVDGETKRTKTVDNIHNPVWNENFYFKLDKIPEKIDLRVRDDRTLLPNLNLGHYSIPVKEKLNNYNASQSLVIVEDGQVDLRDVLTGKLDIRVSLMNVNANMINSNVDILSYDSSTLPLQSKTEGPFEEVKKSEFEKLPEVLNQTVKVFDDKKDEHIINDSNEVYTLPTLHVQEQPIIVEKEIEYIKPVEVHQTIIHRVKPTVIEKPVIVEKHEHYRAPTETIRQEEKIVRERVDETNISSDEQAIENLRSRRKAEFNDKTPIIQFEKEQVKLDTNIEQKPTEIREKEVVYEQPIEIERKEIEHVKEKVIENVTLQKEHVHQKVEPEIIRENVEVINTGDRFYSQNDTATATATATATEATTTTTSSSSSSDPVPRIENMEQV